MKDYQCQSVSHDAPYIGPWAFDAAIWMIVAIIAIGVFAGWANERKW